MATTTRKRKTRVTGKGKPFPKKLHTTHIEGENELEVKGGRLVVRLSRESHPEIFDIDRLIKMSRKMLKSYGRKRKTRDLCQFLVETEKSLQIILRNHLEDAMRKYLE